MERQPGTSWWSLFQFAFSGLALLGLLGLALLSGVSALPGFGTAAGSSSDSLALLLRATGMLAAAVLIFPSLALSFLRLIGAPFTTWAKWQPWMAEKTSLILLAGIIFLWVVAWQAGPWVFHQPTLAWFLAPPVYLLSGALPIAMVLLVGARGLPGGSAQRRWGIFAASLAGSTLVILIIEILALLALVALAAVVVASNPTWTALLRQFAQQLSSNQVTPEDIGRFLQPLLSNPWIVALVLGFISGLVPLVEELFKPLPVYFLLGRQLTPGQGLVAGLISGAGFAFFESLNMLSAVPGSDWVSLVAGRAGTDLLHITTTGLMGWALAATWRDHHYGRLALSYLVAVMAHGLWNFFSLVMGVLPFSTRLQGPSLGWLQNSGEIGLALLAPLLLGFLITLNAKLRAQARVSLVESDQT